jgi:hypothetical protein
MGPLEYVESSANDFAWAHYFSYDVPPMYWDGPTIFYMVQRRCTGMGPLDLQWQLPMTLPGPITFQAAAVNALGWAHWIWGGSCQWHCLGPLLFQQVLPMP